MASRVALVDGEPGSRPQVLEYLPCPLGQDGWRLEGEHGITLRGGELAKQELRGRLLFHPRRDAAGLGRVVADNVLQIAVSVAAAAQADLAWHVRVVAMQVDRALAAAAEALLHSLGVGVAEVGWLRNAKLEAEPRDEVDRGEAKEGVGELGLEDVCGRACASVRVHEVAVPQRVLLRAQRARRGDMDLLRPLLLQFRS